MRIALLTRNFSRMAGGAESYAISVAQELARHHEIHVFCQETDEPVSGAIYHLVKRPCRRPRWINQIYYALATWWQTRHGYDVVHSHEHVFHGQVQTLHVQPVARGIWGQRKGWRLILRALSVLTSPRRMTYAWLESARMKVIDGRRLVFASPQLMSDFLPFYPGIESISHVIPPGVQCPVAPMDRGGSRQALAWNVNESWLLFVANDYQRKGLDTLLEAMVELPSSFRLAVVGRASQQATYTAKVAQKGLSNRIQFLGPRHDVHRLMAAADLLVHPTLEDSFGMVVLEAMAMGLPVIVSPAPYCGMSADLTHLKQAWLLSSPKDALGIADAVREVLGNKSLRQSLMSGGLEEARHRSWADAALKYEKIFTS